MMIFGDAEDTNLPTYYYGTVSTLHIGTSYKAVGQLGQIGTWTYIWHRSSVEVVDPREVLKDTACYFVQVYLI